MLDEFISNWAASQQNHMFIFYFDFMGLFNAEADFKVSNNPY